MKKIEIITMHRIVNFGSVLQAYATQEILKKLKYDPEFIDYYPERMHLVGMLKRIKKKNKKLEKSIFLRTIARLIIFPSYLKRFYVFKKFIKEYLKLSEKQYRSFEELDKDYPKAEIYCTGSDQVWNSGWNEKIDRVFFLDFLKNNEKRIAYAASFGKSELENWEKEETKIMLKNYSAISLREQSGVKILNDLEIKGSINVLDPTLLLTGKEWDKISSRRYKNEEYILVYNLNRNKKIDNYALELSKKTGLKIKFLSYQFHEFYKKGKIICNPKVKDFLALIKNANYIVTDSFHATAFSLNFNKEFIIVYPEKYSTRLQSILNILGLQNRVAKNERDVSIIESKINYIEVNKLLDKEREKSINWLAKNLKD